MNALTSSIRFLTFLSLPSTLIFSKQECKLINPLPKKFHFPQNEPLPYLCGIKGLLWSGANLPLQSGFLCCEPTALTSVRLAWGLSGSGQVDFHPSVFAHTNTHPSSAYIFLVFMKFYWYRIKITTKNYSSSSSGRTDICTVSTV